MRLFIALPLPEEIKKYLGEIIDELRPSGQSVRWVKPENIHLTVRFLGETDENTVPKLTSLLDKVAAEFSASQLQLGRLGAFPNFRRPNVFWVGLEGDSSELTKMARQVELGVRTLRFEREKKGFRPHLTLGRVKRGRDVRPVVATMETWAVSPRNVLFDQLVLFKSDLTPQGAVYTRLHTADLQVERFGG